MATSGATVAAAAAARARREVLAHFEDAEASSPTRAVPYEPRSRLHDRQFKMLARRGILKEARHGRYWLDREELALDAARQARAMKILLASLAAGILVAIGVALLSSWLAS